MEAEKSFPNASATPKPAEEKPEEPNATENGQIDNGKLAKDGEEPAETQKLSETTEEDKPEAEPAVKEDEKLFLGSKRAHSEESSASAKPQMSAGPTGSSSSSAAMTPPPAKKPAAAAKAGLASLVGSLKGPKKQSVLDKSAQDWRQFVQQEQIEEELSSHLRSRDSYLDRQEFLLRADYSQFEKERELRAQQRKTQGQNKPA